MNPETPEKTHRAASGGLSADETTLTASGRSHAIIAAVTTHITRGMTESEKRRRDYLRRGRQWK